MTNTKILIADDHPILRAGMREALARQPDITVVGEAATGAQGLHLAQQLTPDLVVMDAHLADMSGMEATQRLLDASPYIKVVIFSGDADRASINQALQAGARGYLTKTSSLEELVHAVGIVMEGHLFLSPEVTTIILEEYRKNLAHTSAPPTLSYSEKEKQLLKLVAEGRRNKEIAAALAVSTKSIETYRSRVMKKAGCTSSAELVRYAIRAGFAAL